MSSGVACIHGHHMDADVPVLFARLRAGTAVAAAKPGLGGNDGPRRYAQSDGSAKGDKMAAERGSGRGVGGISVGGIIVIIGIVLMIAWSFWVGLIVTLIGLVAFGGFARGKWY